MNIIDSKVEDDIRAEISRLLFYTSQKLELQAQTAAIASVFMHRYIDFKGIEEVLSESRIVLCSALIFLTSKVNESSRSSRDIINVVHKLLYPDRDRLSSNKYVQLKEAVIDHEQVILRSLRFDTFVNLPYPYMLNYARSLLLTKSVVQLAWKLLCDSFLSKDCIITKPNVIACSSLYLAIETIGNRNSIYNKSSGDKENSILENEWWKIFDVTNDELYSASMAVIACQEKYTMNYENTNLCTDSSDHQLKKETTKFTEATITR